MAKPLQWQLNLRPPLGWVLLLCGLYLITGMADHDPWKTEDARHIRIAYDFFTGKEGWLPPFAEPLYYWLAAATAWLTRDWLPFHAGARLASTIFGVIALVALANAAERDEKGIAPLLAIGTLGFLTIHEAQPVVAVLAGISCIYWGLVHYRHRVVMGVLITGIGLGMFFLSGGLRFFEAGWRHPTWAHFKLLMWFTWPVLPLAVWSVWLNRRRLNLLPLWGTLCALLWFLTHEARYTFALPLLVPLVLLAADGSTRLRRGAASAFDWFGGVTFTGVIGLIWLGASALLLGWPAPIARNFAKLVPGFHSEVSFVALTAGMVVTALWGWQLIKLPRSPGRPVLRWASGVTLSWVLLTVLWMPWINAYKIGKHIIP